MSKPNTYRYLLAATLVWMLGFSTQAQVEESRHITETFLAEKGITVDISNKYGTVNISTWDVDSVKIDIDLVVRAKNYVKMAKIKDGIDFDISSTSHYVIAKTMVGQDKASYRNDINEAVEAIFSSNNSIQIDYEVMIPKHANVRIVNKFGDVYCDDLTGDARIRLSHGDLKASTFTGNTQIDIKFGNGTVREAQNGRFTIEYGRFDLKQANDISIKSKSSTVTIGQVNELKIASRSDKYFIREVNQLYGESTFTDHNIDLLTSKLDIIGKYGEININELPAGFESLKVRTNYTDLNFAFNNDAGYHLDLTQKKVILSYPTSKGNLETSTIPEDDKMTRLVGPIGNTSSSSVVINAESCDIYLRYR